MLRGVVQSDGLTTDHCGENQLVHTLRQKDHSVEEADPLGFSLTHVTKQVKDMDLLVKSRWYSNICSHINGM